MAAKPGNPETANGWKATPGGGAGGAGGAGGSITLTPDNLNTTTYNPNLGSQITNLNLTPAQINALISAGVQPGSVAAFMFGIGNSTEDSITDPSGRTWQRQADGTYRLQAPAAAPAAARYDVYITNAGKVAYAEGFGNVLVKPDGKVFRYNADGSQGAEITNLPANVKNGILTSTFTTNLPTAPVQGNTIADIQRRVANGTASAADYDAYVRHLSNTDLNPNNDIQAPASGATVNATVKRDVYTDGSGVSSAHFGELGGTVYKLPDGRLFLKQADGSFIAVIAVSHPNAYSNISVVLGNKTTSGNITVHSSGHNLSLELPVNLRQPLNTRSYIWIVTG